MVPARQDKETFMSVAIQPVSQGLVRKSTTARQRRLEDRRDDRREEKQDRREVRRNNRT
jgi:hypothetical protein